MAGVHGGHTSCTAVASELKPETIVVAWLRAERDALNLMQQDFMGSPKTERQKETEGEMALRLWQMGRRHRQARTLMARMKSWEAQ